MEANSSSERLRGWSASGTSGQRRLRADEHASASSSKPKKWDKTEKEKQREILSSFRGKWRSHLRNDESACETNSDEEAAAGLRSGVDERGNLRYVDLDAPTVRTGIGNAPGPPSWNMSGGSCDAWPGMMGYDGMFGCGYDGWDLMGGTPGMWGPPGMLDGGVSGYNPGPRTRKRSRSRSRSRARRGSSKRRSAKEEQRRSGGPNGREQIIEIDSDDDIAAKGPKRQHLPQGTASIKKIDKDEL